jgi:signal transduction histidine kinase
MRTLLARLAGVCVGFVKSLGFTVAGLSVPAVIAMLPVLAGLRVFGTPWSWTNAWSWGGLLIIAVVLILAGARPVGTLFRLLVFRWGHVAIAAGYRRPESEPAPVLLSTGYWWNGHSYERTRRDAETDQQWRRRVGDPAYWRDVRWVVLAAIAVAPVCAIAPGTLTGAIILFAQPTTADIWVAVMLIVVSALSASYGWRVVTPLAERWLRPKHGDATSLRVRELEQQRSDLTVIQAAEIRRIERDLHDGAQARLIAVGLALATAEKLMDVDPERAKSLLRDAREGTSDSLAELRDLVRGVNPPVLVERGAVEAIRALAIDSGLNVHVDSPTGIRLESPIEAALYFSVAELLANVAKYASSARVDVHVRQSATAIEVEVTDDGQGGATIVPGSGLDGIRRRVAAFDGTLTVTSPSGGPTRSRIVIPCVSS